MPGDLKASPHLICPVVIWGGYHYPHFFRQGTWDPGRMYVLPMATEPRWHQQIVSWLPAQGSVPWLLGTPKGFSESYTEFLQLYFRWIVVPKHHFWPSIIWTLRPGCFSSPHPEHLSVEGPSMPVLICSHTAFSGLPCPVQISAVLGLLLVISQEGLVLGATVCLFQDCVGPVEANI